MKVHLYQFRLRVLHLARYQKAVGRWLCNCSLFWEPPEPDVFYLCSSPFSSSCPTHILTHASLLYPQHLGKDVAWSAVCSYNNCLPCYKTESDHYWVMALDFYTGSNDKCSVLRHFLHGVHICIDLY